MKKTRTKKVAGDGVTYEVGPPAALVPPPFRCAPELEAETETRPIRKKPKKPAKVTPTRRTLVEMRRRGYLADVVERFIRIPGGRSFKKDLFGGFDVAAVGRPEGKDRAELVLVQTTSADNVASRLTKIAELPALPLLREAGIRLLVHGWGEPTKTRRTWRLREDDIS